MLSDSKKAIIKEVKVKVIAGAILAVLGYICTLIYNWYTKTPVLVTALQWKDFAINNLLAFANYPIKLWWIFAVIALIALIIFVLVLLDNSTETGSTITTNTASGRTTIPLGDYNLQRKQTALKGKLEYIAAKFDGIIWRWDWIFNDLIKDYEVKNIAPCCPEVDCKNEVMTVEVNGLSYNCPNCSKSRMISTTPNALLPLIEKQGAYRMTPQYELLKDIRH